MKRYVVTLDEAEREELSDITTKGSHSSQKVINAFDPAQLRTRARSTNAR